ncbi:unnamed protein product, partial [Sphacelaria rigidula]
SDDQEEARSDKPSGGVKLNADFLDIFSGTPPGTGRGTAAAPAVPTTASSSGDSQGSTMPVLEGDAAAVANSTASGHTPADATSGVPEVGRDTQTVAAARTDTHVSD